MKIIKNILESIPVLSLSKKNRIIIGAALIIPLYIVSWLLSIFIGILSTTLSEFLGISNLGLLLLRVCQIIIFYFLSLIGVKLILNSRNLGIHFGKKGLYDFIIGSVVGGFSVIFIFIIMFNTGMLRIETYAFQRMPLISFVWVFFTFIISNLSIGFTEEIVFRGYLVKVFKSAYGKGLTVILSGLIFSFFHLIFTPLDNISQMLWILFELIPAGLLLSWIYVNTKSLLLVISLHASYNFAQQALDIYGRYGENNNWDKMVILGNSIHGSRILVGTTEGSAGLIHLLSIIIMFIMMIIFIKKFRGKNDNIA